jgi:peptidyl-prolyl cis-trans isomerase SurA
MKSFRLLRHGLLALLLTSTSFAPAAIAQSGSIAVDGIAAIVDEDVILHSELDRAVSNITAQYSRQAAQLPPRQILEKQVLERLVLQKVQMARAQAVGLRISDAELDQAIQQVAAQNQMTIDQMRLRLQQEGIGFAEYRVNLRDEIMMQRFRQGYLQNRVQVSETEIDQLLATREIGGTEYRLANILVGLPEGATPEQIATAQQKIQGISQLIARGEIDFRAAAIRYSDSQNALDGGEIGWRTMDAIPPVFASLIRGMQPGQVSQPVRGPSGFQLIQVVEVRQQQAQQVTEYQAQGILVRISEVTSAEVARDKAERLRERILAGEDFATVAKESSEDNYTRSQGGDMGWFQGNQWGSAIGNQVANMVDGEVSPVFQSDAGFHIIKRTGSRIQDVTVANRRNQAREIIVQRKSEEEFERFLRQLRSEAYVESRLVVAP